MTEFVAGRLVEMAVRVDAAGQHEETICVDFASACWKIDGEGGDPAGAHPDVGSEHVDSSGRRSPSDDEIELRHSGFLQEPWLFNFACKIMREGRHTPVARRMSSSYLWLRRIPINTTALWWRF